MLAHLAIVLAANVTSVDDAKVSIDVLKNANLHTVSLGAKGQARTHTGPTVAARAASNPGVDTLTFFSDTFTTPGFDHAGNPNSVWSYEMVGRAPERGGTTILPAPVIPVVVDLLGPDGKVASFHGHPLTFDGRQFVQPVLRSPIFQRFPFFAGNTQFNDALMRTQFADRIHRGHGDADRDDDNGYHVLLDPDVKTARRMQIPFGKFFFFTDANGVPEGALVDAQTFVNLLFPSTVPVDNTTPIGAAELAGDMRTRDLTTFLFDNIFLFEGKVSNCCILGFHSVDVEPGDARNGNRDRLFVFDFASWIDPGLFAFGFEDITAMSHEISESFADPLVDNETPWWLSTDPFGLAGSLCQDNLENGDVVEVLSSNAVFPIQMNGRTYHPQNVAVFSWFAFQSPSRASNGSYSFPDETTLTALSPAGLGPGCTPPTP
jgi:hypothetical protein